MFLEDYVFKGDQCDKVIKLTAKIDNESNSVIFSSTIDLFIFSALVGCLQNVRNKPSKDLSRTTKIFVGQFVSHSNDLKLALKFVLLTCSNDSEDEVTRLNKTFRNPETDENYQLFEEYMLGGLETIYNNIIVDSNNRYIDYLTAINKLMASFKNTPSDDPDDRLGDNLFF